MFPVLHDCMDQLSWQKRSDMDSAVWMREVEMILSLLLNKSDWRVWGADSCVLVCSQLPGTALHGLKHIWNMGHDPTTGNKRASCFWRSAEGAILLVLGHQGSISLPSHERHPRGVLSPSPQSWLHATYSCNTPPQAVEQTKELGNSWQRNPVYWFTQHLCMRFTASSFTAFTRKCHCSLQYKTKSGELVNVFVFATTSF